MVMGSDFEVFKIGASYKCFNGHCYTIDAYGYPETMYLKPYSFSYLPLYISSEVINLLELNNVQEGFKSLEEVIELINIIVPKISSFSINLSMEGITEITEEEYYKID